MWNRETNRTEILKYAEFQNNTKKPLHLIIQGVINEIGLNVLLHECDFIVKCYAGYLCHKRVFINQEFMQRGSI